MTNPSANAYLKTKVMTASPLELRLMLFDGAIRFAEQARTAIEQRDWEEMLNGITRCQQIIMELINSLRPEANPELCDKLSSLYTFMYTQLMQANSKRDGTLVEEVVGLLKFERDTWAMLLERLAKENTSAARNMQSAPEAEPALPPRNESPEAIIGANLSLRG
jgi:flagellar secretion chaperone FliS